MKGTNVRKRSESESPKDHNRKNQKMSLEDQVEELTRNCVLLNATIKSLTTAISEVEKCTLAMNDRLVKVENIVSRQETIEWKTNDLEQQLLTNSIELTGFLRMHRDDPLKFMIELCRVTGVPFNKRDYKEVYAINYKDGKRAKICVTFYDERVKNDIMQAMKARRLAKNPIKLGELTGVIIHDTTVVPDWGALKIGAWNKLTQATKTLLQLVKERNDQSVEYVYEQSGRVLIKFKDNNKRRQINSPSHFEYVLSQHKREQTQQAETVMDSEH